MANAIGPDVSREIATLLDMQGLLSFGTCGRSMHHVAAGIADDRMRKLFAGVQPRAATDGTPFWVSMWEALRPARLHYTYFGKAPDCTRLLNMVLDSAGPWFLEFVVIVAKAPNGTPCLGLVAADAQLTEQQREAGRVPWDMSRKGLGDLAISFSPEYGQVYASGLKAPRSEDAAGGPKSCLTAMLKWERCGDSSKRWNAPLKAGILLDAGKLTFFRGNQKGTWHSSGAVFSHLPAQVIPAVFLSSFAGHASMRFLNLGSSPPEVFCAHCDALDHGFQSWETHPLSDQ